MAGQLLHYAHCMFYHRHVYRHILFWCASAAAAARCAISVPAFSQRWLCAVLAAASCCPTCPGGYASHALRLASLSTAPACTPQDFSHAWQDCAFRCMLAVPLNNMCAHALQGHRRVPDPEAAGPHAASPAGADGGQQPHHRSSSLPPICLPGRLPQAAERVCRGGHQRQRRGGEPGGTGGSPLACCV